MTTTTLPRWKFVDRNPAAEQRLVADLGVSPLVAAILAQRGYLESADAERFLNPRLEDLHSPSLLPDFAQARDAILGAVERKDLIFVHGDYDVDGVTSAAIFHRFLTRIGANVHTHVPHRMKEGYGIHLNAVDAAHALGTKLFLTCDCGVGAIEQVARARELGMRVVVTDHHTIGATLPDAEAVVNPHRLDSAYPFAELSGAGVAYKLCLGLSQELNIKPEHFHRAFLDLAVLGTIADVMPLVGENRIIAALGLTHLRESKKPGLRALIDVCKLGDKPITTHHVGFQLAPRINSSGRIDDAARALQLLIENDDLAAAQIAREIDQLNTERRTEQERMVAEAVAWVEETGANRDPVLVVGNAGWHSGIIGIVASKLVERFYRPTFVYSHDPLTQTCKASARTIAGFHLADAIRALDPLVKGGGHAAAAGCSFAFADLANVQNALIAHANEVLTEEDFMPLTYVDLEVTPPEVTLPAVYDLERMGPFGMGNPRPVVAMRNVRLVGAQATKRETSKRLTLATPDGATIQSIFHEWSPEFEGMTRDRELDVLCKPAINTWNGRDSVEWNVKEFVPR